MPTTLARFPLLLVALAMSVLLPARAFAHCDGLDGPVVKSARAALEARNVALVAVWVQPQDEPEIRRAFEQTLAVRTLNPQAKELADRFFFETVVRVHRAGEGAPLRDSIRRAAIWVRRFLRQTRHSRNDRLSPW